MAMPAGLHGLPRNKVAKRLREGKHHNLFQFYVHAITGDTPQGARVHQWTEDQKTGLHPVEAGRLGPGPFSALC